MTSVLVGIPILKDARRFHVLKGRRWTIFEHIVLEALAKQDWSISELVEASDLPRRVVIEILIRLMRAGWVQLTPRADSVIFAATSRGRLNATQPELPLVPRPDSRFIGFSVDLLTGSIFRVRDLAAATYDQWQKRATGRPAVLISDVGGMQTGLADVRRLADTLLEPDEELIRIDVQDWRPRRRVGIVSVRGEEIEGLGGTPTVELRNAVLEAAKQAERRSADDTPTTITVPRLLGARSPARRAISYRFDDLIVGGDAHAVALEKVLTRVQSRLVIHSTFITAALARKAIEKLKIPLQRGAVIDILWGKSDEKDKVNTTREAAKELGAWLQQEGLADRIRVHQVSTGSHAKILFWDAGTPGRFYGIIGSCNWLSTNFRSFDVSVRLREAGIVADVAFELAELIRPADGQVPDLSAELVRIGRNLDRDTTASATDRSFAQLVLGPDHARVLLQARDDAKARVLITSHRLGANVKPVLKTLSAAAQINGVSPEVYYGRPTGAKVTPAVVEEAAIRWREEGIGIMAVRKPRLHAKMLAWDSDDVVITSQNWLSADPSEMNPRDEIGVHVHGPEVAQRIVEAFAAARELASPTS
jgi:cardiolipin synthase A/B